MNWCVEATLAEKIHLMNTQRIYEKSRTPTKDDVGVLLFYTLYSERGKALL